MKCSACGASEIISAATRWCPTDGGLVEEALSAETVARARGWRTYQGESLTGKPLSLAVCPKCVGQETDSEGAPQEADSGWDAECHTCNEMASDSNSEPITEADAEEWADSHECEPDVGVIAPTRTTARRGAA